MPNQPCGCLYCRTARRQMEATMGMPTKCENVGTRKPTPLMDSLIRGDEKIVRSAKIEELTVKVMDDEDWEYSSDTIRECLRCSQTKFGFDKGGWCLNPDCERFQLRELLKNG